MAIRNVNKVVLPRQTVSGTHNTFPLYLGDSTGASFHIIWEGSPAAAITLQTSNDPRVQTRPEEAAWFTESTTISGLDGAVADGSVMATIDNLNCTYARLGLAVTASGVVSVISTSKE